MGRAFWILTGLFTALAVHTTLVLAVPSFTLKRAVSGLAARQGANRFFVMEAADQTRLFPTYPASSLIGACAFDVTGGPVDLTGSMPPGFWTLAIYSSAGEVLYTANNTQAGTNNFTLRLQRAPDLLDMLKETGSEESSVSSAWTVKTSDPRGLAILWQPLADAAMRPAAVQVINGSACQPASNDG